ncbi:MAG: sensor histidine kinase [Cyclobacteriaceae bacterium]
MKAEKKAYNAIKISKYAIGSDSAMLYANQALALAESDTTKILAANQKAWLLKNDKNFEASKSLLTEYVKKAEKIDFDAGLSDLYITYGSVFSNLSMYDSAMFYQKLALEKMTQLNDLNGKASVLNNLSIVYQKIGKFDLSKSALFESLEIRRKQGLNKEIGDIYLNLGNVFFYNGQIDSCIYSFIKALKIYEEEKLPNFQVYALTNLAYIYNDELGDPESAKKYLIKTLQIEEKLKSKSVVISAMNGLGTYYKDINRYDSAEFYYRQAIELSKEFNNPQNRSLVLANLGSLKNEMGDHRQAKALLSEALTLKLEINDLNGQVSTYTMLGKSEIALGEFNAALGHLTQAYDLAKKIENRQELKEIIAALIDVNKKTKNYSHTIELFEEYISLKDSLLNAEKLSIISELQTQYETEKKEQTIALQTAEIDSQAAELKVTKLLSVGLVVLVILLLVIGIQQRKYMLNKRDKLIAEEKARFKESQIEAAITTQEEERKRFARDLHDGFGQMISVLNLNLSNLDSNPEKRQEVYDNSTEVLDQMYKELKSICFNLMPETLIKNGLLDAINEFASRINNAGKIQIETNFFGIEERLTDLQEISLYRITQEWVNNVIKYSEAKNITIQLTKDEEELNLLIEDDGMGFDKSLLTQGSGNGWKNLNSRANLIKGELELDTVVGRRGTTMIVIAPELVVNQNTVLTV